MNDNTDGLELINDSMDIPDELLDVSDEDLDGVPREVVTGEVVDDDIVLADDGDLTYEKAVSITDAIKSTAVATSVLLAQAHRGKAYKALGYDTWRDYVASEFSISESHSYRLLNFQSVVEEIEQAAPEGFQASLTQAQASDIKRELPHITERIREETAGRSPEEANDIIESIIEERREDHKAEAEAQKKKEDEEREQQEIEEQNRRDKETDEWLEEHDSSPSLGGDAVESDDGYNDYSDVSGGTEGESADLNRRKKSMFKFMSIMADFESLPEPLDIISVIPQDREDQVSRMVAHIEDWLVQFKDEWERETGNVVELDDEE